MKAPRKNSRLSKLRTLACWRASTRVFQFIPPAPPPPRFSLVILPSEKRQGSIRRGIIFQKCPEDYPQGSFLSSIFLSRLQASYKRRAALELRFPSRNLQRLHSRHVRSLSLDAHGLRGVQLPPENEVSGSFSIHRELPGNTASRS